MADLQENKTCSGERTPTNSRPIPPPRSSTKKADKMDSDSMTDSDLSDWETRRFGHTNITSPPLIPRQSAENISPSSSPNKRTYPSLFDSGLDSTNFSSELFPKKRHTDQFKWTPDKENRFHGNWNNSVSSHDSAIGGSLFSAFGSVLTDSSSSFESQVNSEESASNLSSPAHSVYGRYQKTQDEKTANVENETEMLVLHRLPGENLGMILGIEGGKSKESVSGVYVKTVTIGGAAYRATGGTKGIEVGDRILQINGTDINTLTHDECLSVLREMPLRVILKVLRNQNKKIPSVTSPAPSIRSQRSYDSSRCGMTSEYSESSSYSESEDDGNTDGKCDGFDLIRVEIDKNPNESLGLSIVPSYGSTRQFYQIKRILPSGAAARSQQLKVGDRLVSCNGISLRNVSQNWCLTTLKSEGNNGDIELQVYRQSEKESQLEISLRVSNRAGIAGGNDSTVTLRSPHADRHFFSEVPNSDSDNEVILNKFQFIENHNNHFGQTSNESKNHKTPLRESKKERESRNRIVSSEQEEDTDPEIAAITGKKDKSKMESEGGGSYIPPPVEFSAFGPAVPPPKEFSEGQSPIFDQTRNDGMPVTNIDEILNSYPHTGIVSSGPMDSSDQNSNSFKSPITSKGTGSYDNNSHDQRLNSDEEEIDSLDNSMEINGEANNSVHIGAPEEFANQEYIEVSESYLAKEDQDEQISKSESSPQECEVNSFSNGGVGDEYIDKFPRNQVVSGSININHSKLSGDINEQSPEEIVVPVKIQRRTLESTPVSISSENKVSSGDVDEDVIVPSVINRENLSHTSSVEVKKPKTETEVDDKVIPTPRPRPQPRTNRTVKSGSEARQMDENSISHPKYPPPVQTETEDVGVEEEVMVSVVRPKVDAGKVMEEKLHPGMQEESIVPTEVKRGESAWNPAKMVVITNMWAKSAAENKEKEEIQDNDGKVGTGFKDLLGLVSKAGKKEEAEESDKEDDKNEEKDTSPAAIEEVVLDIKTIDSIDNTQSQEVMTPKQVTMVSVSNDMIPDDRNRQSSESASDQTSEEVVKEQENIEQNNSEIITGDSVVTVSVKSEEPPVNTPEQLVKDVEIPDLSAKTVVTQELEGKPDNSAIIAVEPNIQQDEVRKENKTVINLSHKPESFNIEKSPQNDLEKVSPRGEKSKLPEEEDASNVPEKSPVTSPRQYKSFVSVTKPQSILGTVKSQNASSGLKPLSSIKPLTVSAKTFSLGKPVKYATTISTNSGKPSLLSTIHGSATSAKNSRSEDEPFLVSVLKGILGLGMKVSVTAEGAVQVTEIQQSGPIAKDGNIRVGDYILAINSTELTGLADSKVQQILRLLPRGLAKIMVSTRAPTSDNPDLAESSAMPIKVEDKKPPAREEPKTLSRISLPSPVIHSRKMPLTTSKSTDTSASTGTASSSSLSVKQNTSDHHGDNRSSRSEESLMSSESKREEKAPEDNHAFSKKSPPKVAPKPKHRTTANETTANVPSVKGQGGYVSSAVGRSRSFENKGPAQAEREPPFQKRKADYVSSARKITTHPEKSDSKSEEPIDTVIFASVNHGKDDKVSKASSNRDSQGQPEPRLIPHGHVDYISSSKPKQAPAPPPKPKPVNAMSPKSKDIQISPYAYEETTKKVIPNRLNSALSPRRKSGDQGAFKFGASLTKNQSKGKDSTSELDASPVASPRSISSPTSPKSPFGDVISPVSSPKTLSTPPPQSSTSPTPLEVKKEGIHVSPVPSPRRKSSNQAPALSPNIQEDDSAHFDVGASPPQSPQDSPSSHVNVGPKIPTQIFDSESPPQPDSFEVKEDRAPSPTPNVVSLHSVDVVKSDAPVDDTQVVNESNDDESLPLTSESESPNNADEGEKKVISENDFDQLLNLEDFAESIVKDAIQRGIDEFKDSEEKNNNSEDCDIVSENNMVSESTNQTSDDFNTEGKMVDDNVLALGVVDVHEQALQNVKPVMETKSLRAFLEKLDNSNNTANQELPPPDTFSVSDHPVAANIALDMVNDKHVDPISDTDLSVVNSNNDASARFGEECNTNITAQNQGEDTRIANSREENRSEETKDNITGDGLIDPSISESNEIKPFASGVCMQASPDLTDSPNLACSNINVVASHDLLGMPTDTQTNLTSKDFIVSDPFSMQGDILHRQQTEEAVGEEFTDNLCKEVNHNVVNSSNITQDENVTVCDSNNEGSLVQDSAKESAPVHSSHGSVDQTLDEEEQTKGDNSNIEISVQMDLSRLKDNNITDSSDDTPVLCDFSKLVSKRQWTLLQNGKQEVYVSSSPQNLLDSNILTSTTSNVTSAQKVGVLLEEANSVMDQCGLSEEDEIMVIHLHREDVDNPVGLALKQGKDGNILVSGILPGGLLPVDGKVDVNDHLLLVNGESVKSKQIRDITESFDSLEKDFTLVLSKPASQMSEFDSEGQRSSENIVLERPESEGESGDDAPPALPESPPPFALSQNDGSKDSQKSADVIDNIGLQQEDSQETNMDTVDKSDTENVKVNSTINTGVKDTEVNVIDEDVGVEVKVDEIITEIPGVIEEEERIYSTEDVQVKVNDDSTEEPYVIDDVKVDSIVDVEVKVDEVLNNDRIDSNVDNKVKVTVDTEVKVDDNCNEAPNVTDSGSTDSTTEMEVKVNENSKEDQNVNDDGKTNFTINEEVKVKDIEVPEVMDKAKSDATSEAENISKLKINDVTDSLKNQFNGQNDEPESDDGELKTYEVSMQKGVTGLGFLIAGGIASPKGDQPISIRRIFKGGPAEKCGQLKVRDEILLVNGVDISQMRHSEAWTHLKFLDDGEVKLLIRRKVEKE